MSNYDLVKYYTKFKSKYHLITLIHLSRFKLKNNFFQRNRDKSEGFTGPADSLSPLVFVYCNSKSNR